MTTKAPRTDAQAATELTDTQVSDFLRDNPDFLKRHPQLLSVMYPPEREFYDADPSGGEVVDLQDAMLARVRSELSRKDDQCSDLIDASRTNMQSQTRVHAAVLALLKARSLDHLIEILTIDLAGLLHVDAAALCLEGGTVAPSTNQGVRVVPAGTIEKIVETSRVVTLRDSIEGDRRIYGEAAGLVRSEALLRLAVREDAPVALLALGSRDPSRFHPGQGSELLVFLASIMEHCIRTWLDLPR
ncbi:MAG: hypothetical protein CL566_02955 [Alphaproteobacteria bacterium]|nr:hypothetical protein [Alphaproteobacteria bacterium]